MDEPWGCYTKVKEASHGKSVRFHFYEVSKQNLNLTSVGLSTIYKGYFSSIQFSCSVMSDSLWPHELQHARPPCPSQTPGVFQTNVHWVSDEIQPSHPLLSPSPPAFNLSQHQGLFKGVRSSRQVAKVLVSASASVLPMNIQDWFPLEWTGWISLQSKGLSRVFSNTTVQKHQFFSAQLSL